MRKTLLLILIGLFLAISLHTSAQGVLFFDPAEGARQVKWSPDGTMIATANPDGKVWLWDENGQLLTSFVADPEGVYTIDWNSDGILLASSGYDGIVKIWDLNGDLLSSFATNVGQIAELIWYENDTYIVTLSFNKVSIWDSSDGNAVTSFFAPSPIDLNFNSDFTQFAMIYSANHLRISSGNDLSMRVRVEEIGDYSSLMAIAWNPDSSIIASGNTLGNIMLWDMQEQSSPTMLTTVESIIQDILWSPDNTRLVVATNDGHVYTVDAETGDILGTIKAGGPVLNADWKPDGDEVAYIVYDGDDDLTNDLQIFVPPNVDHAAINPEATPDCDR